MKVKYIFIVGLFFGTSCLVHSQQLMVAGRPSQLTVRKAGDKSLRITLKPTSYSKNFPSSPAVVERNYGSSIISVNDTKSVATTSGNFKISIKQNPLSIKISDKQDRPIQNFVFSNDGNLIFQTKDELLLGLGEGGSKPLPGVN